MVQFFDENKQEISVEGVERIEDVCKYVFVSEDCVPFATRYESFEACGWYVYDVEWGGTWRHLGDVIYLARLYADMWENISDMDLERRVRG